MPALALANAVQNSVHAIVLLVILRIVIGPLKLGQIIPTILKIGLATVVMVVIAWGLQVGLGSIDFFAQQLREPCHYDYRSGWSSCWCLFWPSDGA